MNSSIYTILIFGSFILQGIELNAQLNNSGFEIWVNDKPDLWETSNLPYLDKAIVQDTVARTGNYSVKGVVVNNNARPYPPYLSNPYNSNGTPVVAQHDTMSGWVQTGLIGSDQLLGTTVLYSSNFFPIAKGQIVINGNNTSWTYFSAPIQYFAGGIPAFAAMFFTITDSTGVASGAIGSFFRLDDVELTGP